MDNQHRKITGYRELNEQELEAINRGKDLAEEVREWLESLDHYAFEVDTRWRAIGRTNLQQGFMAVIRAIAKPETF
jgi:hypothetical protein